MGVQPLSEFWTTLCFAASSFLTLFVLQFLQNGLSLVAALVICIGSIYWCVFSLSVVDPEQLTALVRLAYLSCVIGLVLRFALLLIPLGMAFRFLLNYFRPSSREVRPPLPAVNICGHVRRSIAKFRSATS